MNVQNVKSAEGRRVRDPRTGNVLPNVADKDADQVKGVAVDLDDTYWFRSMAGADIVLVDDDGAPIVTAPVADPAADKAPAAAIVSAPASTSSSATPAAAPVAAPAPAVTPAAAPATSPSAASSSPTKTS